MKILHTSDWHVDHRTVGVSRFDEVCAAAWQTVDAAKREKVDLYAMTGDLADPDGGTGVLRCVELVVAIDRALCRVGIRRIWVAGNHDVVEDGTTLTTLTPLRGLLFHNRLMPNGEIPLFVCDRPEVLLPGDLAARAGVEGVGVIALPYAAASNPYDPVEFVRAAKAKLQGVEKVVVLTHLQVEGALLGEETTDLPRGRDVRFPHEEMELGWTILAGHYHRRQTIGRPGLPPVHVVGALARLAFGEQSNTPSYSIVEI